MNSNYLYSFMDRLDDMGKGAWIGLMVLSFVLFWPLGLALLAFLIWSGRMGGKKHRHGAGRWRFERADGEAGHATSRCGGWFTPPSSGNSAFDEYRAETLQRLEHEQDEFLQFLERLRFAKDKEEFDEFLAGRRAAQDTPHDPNPDAPHTPA